MGLISQGIYKRDLSWEIERQVDLHNDPHTSPNLKSLYRGLKGVWSYIRSKWSQHHLTLLKLHPWNPFPLWQGWGECTFQGQEREWDASIALVQLLGQTEVTSFGWPPPTSVYWFIVSNLRAFIYLSHHLGVIHTITQLHTEKYVDECVNMLSDCIFISSTMLNVYYESDPSYLWGHTREQDWQC